MKIILKLSLFVAFFSFQIFPLDVWAVSPKSETADAPQAKDAKDSKPEKEAACTVDGHGPYNLNLTQCLQLGSDQAHTNCVLNEKESKIEMQFSVANNKKTAVCVSKLKSGSDDCLEAQCSSGNDTPQH